MVVFKTARNLFKILNAELTPTQIAVGFCLGVFAGIVPFGVHTYFILLVTLVFNCSFSGALLIFPLAKLVSIPLAPVSYALGQFALNMLAPIDSALNQLFHWPILALLEYQYYLNFGSYVLAVLLSVPLFFLVRTVVTRYRQSWLEKLEKKLETSKSYQTLHKRAWLYKGLVWAIGGRAYFREKAPTKRRFFRVMRKESLWLLPAACALTLLLLALLLPLFIGQIVARAATYLIGGEVAIVSASFNSLTGRLVVPKLIVQNPEKQEENILVLDDLVLDVDMPALASKRLVINEASVSKIAFNVRRQSDGSLNLSHLETGQNLESYYDWLAKEALKVDWIKLITEYIRARLEAPHYDALSPYVGARDLPGYAPRFVLEKLKIGRVHLTLSDELQSKNQLPAISMIDIGVDDLSWNSALASKPIRVRLSASLTSMPDGSIQWTGTFDERSAHREFTLALEKIEIATLAPIYEKTVPLKISQGLLSLTSRTVYDRQKANGSANLLIENLKLETDPQLSLFGLDTTTSTAIVEGLNSYAERCPILIEFPISGTWDAPTFEPQGPLLEIAKQGLVWAGKASLFSDALAQIDEKLNEFQSLSSSLLPLPPEANPLQSIFNQLLQKVGGKDSSCKAK
jgi:uncharacterized protein (TIGR03546 family)